MRVFVTGGTGYIGAHIVVELRRRGHQVTVFARDIEKIPSLRKDEGISWIAGDLHELGPLREALAGHEAVIHNALIWNREGEETGLDDLRASVGIFQACALAGVEQLIYTSSAAVHRPFLPLMSPESRIAPDSFYGATKAAAEGFLSAVSYRSDMRCNVVRPGLTVGRPATADGPIRNDQLQDLIDRACRNEEIRIPQGHARQYTVASELARVYAGLLESGSNRRAYVPVSTDTVPLSEIAEEAVRLTGSNSRIVFEGEAHPYRFETKKLEHDLGITFAARESISEHLDYLSTGPSAARGLEL